MTNRVRRCAGWIAILLLAPLLAGPRAAGAAPGTGGPDGPQQMVDAAATIVRHIEADPRYAKQLRTARAVVLIPDVRPAARPGGRTRALLVRHDRDGLWSPPAFLTLGPLEVAAPGAPPAGEGALILMTTRALENVSRPHFTIGSGDEFTVVTFVAKPDEPLGEGDVDIWSGPSGGMAGIALAGAEFAPDAAMNLRYYGRPATSQDILRGILRNPGDKPLRRALPL